MSIWFVSCQNSSRYGLMVKEELVGLLLIVLALQGGTRRDWRCVTVV